MITKEVSSQRVLLVTYVRRLEKLAGFPRFRSASRLLVVLKWLCAYQGLGRRNGAYYTVPIWQTAYPVGREELIRGLVYSQRSQVMAPHDRAQTGVRGSPMQQLYKPGYQT